VNHARVIETLASTERSPATVASAGASALAVAPLLALSVAKLLIQFAGIRNYGFFRDELYYLACSQHLAWGYVDQPPLVALLAWLSRHLFGNSLVSIRIFPAFAGAALVFLTGMLARELGGGRFAQLLAATVMLFAPAFLAFDSFFSMNAFEPLFWILCAWLAVRIVKGANPKLWLAFGAVAGLGLENKHTMLLCGFGLVAGLLLARRFDLFRSPWIWIGGVIALAIFLPNLLWEMRHGWPQIEVVRNAQLFKNENIGPLQFIWEQVLFLHPIAAPVWIAGVAWLFFSRAGKRYRFLGWAYLLVFAIFIIFHGKSYYLLPAHPAIVAAGACALEPYLLRHEYRWLRTAFVTALVIAGLITVPFGVPVLPVDVFLRYSGALPYARSVKTERDATVPLPQLYADMFGWDTLASTVARVYHDLPASDQQDCAIFAGNYGEAGAIDHYGPALGLPKALSGHNAYFYWGPRHYSGACMIILGERARDFQTYFSDSRLVAVSSNPYGMPIEQSVPIYLCRGPRAPLDQLWPRFKLII
jgi:hypothetical protein